MMLDQQIFIGPRFSTKLQAIKAAGLVNLRVVSDFDRTLTQAFVDGVPTYTSFGILQQPGLLSDRFRQYTQQLYQTYRPIELANDLDEQLKMKKMNEWWIYSLQALIDEKIHQDTIKQVVQQSGFVWRTGVLDFFQLTKQKAVPMAIFSSGLGNTIQEYIVHHQIADNLVQVIANFIEFNEAGYAHRYLTPVLHAANKTEATLRERHQRELDFARTNVILLGDQLGDSQMSQETGSGTVLKIGWLNEEITANLAKFQSIFDVVLTGDAPLDFVNDLMDDLI